jgi:hypothetical protein
MVFTYSRTSKTRFSSSLRLKGRFERRKTSAMAEDDEKIKIRTLHVVPFLN